MPFPPRMNLNVLPKWTDPESNIILSPASYLTLDVMYSSQYQCLKAQESQVPN